MIPVDESNPWKVSVPEGTLGNLEVRRFQVERNSIENIRLAMSGRSCTPGTYTQLRRGGTIWMSDTTAEQRDHYDVGRVIRRMGGRVLVGGLGLGMIVHYALQQDNVTHIDVVEIDPEVVALVGPHYLQDPRVHIHTADMYEITWPKGTRWDVAWFDIWPHITADNLPGMARLARSYGKRVDWKGYWAKDLCLDQRDREGRWGW